MAYRVVVKNQANFTVIASAWAHAMRGEQYRITTQDVNKVRRHVVLDVGDGRRILLRSHYGYVTHGKRPPGGINCHHGRMRGACYACADEIYSATAMRDASQGQGNVGIVPPAAIEAMEKLEAAQDSERRAWAEVNAWKHRFEVTGALWLVMMVVAIVAYLMK